MRAIEKIQRAAKGKKPDAKYVTTSKSGEAKAVRTRARPSRRTL